MRRTYDKFEKSGNKFRIYVVSHLGFGIDEQSKLEKRL
jgi:hypothetical protein